MKPLTIKLPEPLEARLAAAGRAHRISRSAMVRHALEHYLGSATGAPQGFASLAGSLQGKMRGPRDLSSNLAHLKDFGR
jgi:metal-responsive CopG/Arc/MetJ family transcriptional regulator